MTVEEFDELRDGDVVLSSIDIYMVLIRECEGGWIVRGLEPIPTESDNYKHMVRIQREFADNYTLISRGRDLPTPKLRLIQ